jgi:hypothetical protein
MFTAICQKRFETGPAEITPLAMEVATPGMKIR